MNKPKIIAVDFDGTLCENRFPEIGEPIQGTIAALKIEQAAGAKVILWTCRRDDDVRAAVEWCAQQGIHLDRVNENLPEMIEFFGGEDTRKVFANEYWDDRAVLMPPGEMEARAEEAERTVRRQGVVQEPEAEAALSKLESEE